MMPLGFTCASCASSIPPNNPRVRCLVCSPPCDMCAICVLGERFKEPHLGTHVVQVLKQSGSTAGGHANDSADFSPTVPTLLGSTAICYYPPLPVPTLPLPIVSEEKSIVQGLESAVAQLSLDPNPDGVDAANSAGPHGGVHPAGANVLHPPSQLSNPPQVQLDEGPHLSNHYSEPASVLLPTVTKDSPYQPDQFAQTGHTIPTEPLSHPLIAQVPNEEAQLSPQVYGLVPDPSTHSVPPATQPPVAQYPATHPLGAPQLYQQPDTLPEVSASNQAEPGIVPEPVSTLPDSQVLAATAVPPVYQHAIPTTASPTPNSVPVNPPDFTNVPHPGPQPEAQPPNASATPPSYQHTPAASPPTGSPFNPTQHMNTPPPVPPRRAPGARNSTSSYSSSTSSYSSPHALPTSNLPPHQNAYHESSPPGWQSLFLADASPSPTFVTLLNDVFTYLDQRNLGNLEPEVFSAFLDDLGYMPHENAWKTGYQATYALSAASMADKTLKNAFDLFSIDHILLRRIQPPHEDPTGLVTQYKQLFGAAFNMSMLQNAGTAHSTVEGPMPAITRKGFIDIMALEAKGEPSREWGNWCRLLRKYQLPRYAGWGDIPRECFLEYPDPVTMRRVEEIRKVGERQAQQQLDAARAYTQLAAQGRQNALDIIGDVRYEYVYR